MIRMVSFAILLLGPNLFAAPPTDKPGDETSKPREVIKVTKVKKVTELDFEDSLIKGKLARPDGNVLLHRTESEGDSWLRLRESFKERVAETRRRVP